MEPVAEYLLTLGALLLLGLLVSTIGHRTILPRVTLLLIFGALIGPEILDLIPDVFSSHFELIANIALLMVGFMLGGKLTRQSLARSASQVVWISVCGAVVTTMVVSIGLILVGVAREIAILLGCIAAATAPAAVFDVTAEAGGNNRFATLLLAVVALDDAWALILFGVGMAVVTSLNGNVAEGSFLLHVTRELGGAVILGLLLGLPAAYLTGRIRPGQPMVTEALGLILLCGGLAFMTGVSFLVAAMVTGATIANLAKHHEHPFLAIENIESMVLVVFFILAGATLDFSALKTFGIIGLVFIACRVAGKYLGVGIGSRISHSDRFTRNWLGLAMLPQAGVPIGMALVAASQFPQYRQLLLSIVIGTTVIFEIVGPIFTRMALLRSGKARK